MRIRWLGRGHAKSRTTSLGLVLCFCAVLAGCGPGDSGSDTGDGVPGGTDTGPSDGGTVSTSTATSTYDVDPASCPGNYPQALTVQTDVPAELDDFSKIVACTPPGAAATFLKNNSDAVWTLSGTGQTPGSVTHYDPTPESISFRSLMNNDSLLVPGDEVVVDLPPDQLEWDIDLPLSITWQGHAVIVESLTSLGQDAVLTALKRESPARAALVKCTLAVNNYANELGDLQDKDDVELTDVVSAGFSAGVTGTSCEEAATRVFVPPSDEQDGLPSLSDRLAHLERNTEVFEHLESRMSTFEKFASGLHFAFKLSPR